MICSVCRKTATVQVLGAFYCPEHAPNEHKRRMKNHPAGVEEDETLVLVLTKIRKKPKRK